MARLRVERLRDEPPARLDPLDPQSPPLLCLAIQLGRTKAGDADEEGSGGWSALRSRRCTNGWAGRHQEGADLSGGRRWEAAEDKALTPQSINLIVKRGCAMSGLELEAFSAQGLRAEYLTEAARQGSGCRRSMLQPQHRSVQQAASYYTEAECAQKAARFYDGANGMTARGEQTTSSLLETLSADNNGGSKRYSRRDGTGVNSSLTLKRLQRLGNRVFLETGNCRLTQRNRLESTMTSNEQAQPKPIEAASGRITRHARILSGQLRSLGTALFPPAASKSLRSFSSGEVAKIVRVSDGYLRQLSLDGLGPIPAIGHGGRRSYTLAQISQLRAYLAQARPREALDFFPRRRDGEKLQIITVANFKGGSAKTTTALYLAQYLALSGLRVLAIDLDPQASLSAMFGYQPEFDIGQNETIYGAIRYDDQRRPMRDVVRQTYFDGIGLVPGNLELMEFEHHTPRAMIDRRERGHDLFFRRVATAIDQIANDYDVVVIDCPPQLGYLTMGALNAATAMLVTIHPQMVDVASMSQFLLMTSDLMSVIEEAGGRLDHDFIRYVITRHDPNDVPEAQIVALLRNLFGSDVLQATVWKSTAIANAGLTKQSLYELDRGSVGRGAYDRALESVDAVNAEIAQLTKKVWGR